MAGAPGQGEKLNVFISYSRDDLDFADQLRAALLSDDFLVTIDRESITPGEDWKQRLGLLIRDADTIVFVLSPSSARSPVFQWEASEAASLNKRLLPILCRPLDDAPPPPELAALQYTYFYKEPKFPGTGFGTGLKDLRLALDADPEWLREHTRYLRLAKEWEDVGRPSDRRLLSAADIALANQWIAEKPEKAAPPTALQLEFIKASEQEDKRRKSAEEQRLKEIADARTQEAEAQKREALQARRVAQRTLAGLVAALILALAAGWFGVNAYRQSRIAETATRSAVDASKDANRERDKAVQATKAANAQRDRALLQESRALAILAQEASRREADGTGDQPTAMLLALEALPEPGFGDREPGLHRPLSYEAAAALHQAWLRNRETALAGHRGAVNVAAFSPDGTHVVTASWDKTARVWDLRDNKPSFVALEGHQGPVNAAAFSPDGTHVVTASFDKTARVWDLRANPPSFVALEGHGSSVKSAAFSPDGTHVVTASWDKTARVWDLREKQPSFVALEGHQDWVNAAAFSPDGTYVVTASLDKTARVWDLREKQPSFVALEGHQGTVWSAAFSPDGTHVVTASSDGTARVWDLREKQPSFVALEGHQGQVVSAAFSRDGTHVVTASFNGTARVWDLREKQPSFVALEGHQGPVQSAAFSPDGAHVVTASWDKTARVWDLRSEKLSFVALEGHQGPVHSAAFSPDGSHVVTASFDKTARDWDLRANPPSFVALEGHQGAVLSAAFSRDGTHVVTASDDKTARIWRVYPDVNELIAEVRPRLSRCLSHAQRDAYGLPTAHPASDRNFIPPPTPDGRCPG